MIASLDLVVIHQFFFPPQKANVSLTLMENQTFFEGSDCASNRLAPHSPQQSVFLTVGV